MKNNTKITVEIFGDTYPVKGDTDPQRVIRTAKFLDERMRKIAKANPHLSPVRIAILAALNITDEYLYLEQDYQQLIEMVKEAKE